MFRLCLRTVLSLSTLCIQWKEEGVARTKFRLALILKSQGKRKESKQLRDEAIEVLDHQQERKDSLIDLENVTDLGCMECLTLLFVFILAHHSLEGCGAIGNIGNDIFKIVFA
jgi:hypothetical protein